MNIDVVRESNGRCCHRRIYCYICPYKVRIL